jgi:hypothetical protein
MIPEYTSIAVATVSVIVAIDRLVILITKLVQTWRSK